MLERRVLPRPTPRQEVPDNEISEEEKYDARGVEKTEEGEHAPDGLEDESSTPSAAPATRRVLRGHKPSVGPSKTHDPASNLSLDSLNLHEQHETDLQLVRKLRVCTVRLRVARVVNEIYETANPEAILTCLIHDAWKYVVNQGVSEARGVLQDWLIQALASFNEHMCRIDPDVPVAHVDRSFSSVASLRFLSRYIFALLKHPVFAAEAIHPDLRIYYYHLMSSLSPVFLSKFIYPRLSSYTTPDSLSRPALYLCRQALASPSEYFYLLDNLVGIYVFYVMRHEQDVFVYPPAHNTLLRQHIQRLKSECPYITPQIVFIREGSPDARYFESRLLDEADAAS
eukprot:TRINITY_DN17664_c0_g1_i4.p1 TRINITY_DN17664_c0_g1~~TRINITY_DN17664_c0_g1_i4.p1  ORF type:complete len:341 (-),score=60.13 TRINITY_DN17664_c0_g1_i4:5-1027(-)